MERRMNKMIRFKRYLPLFLLLAGVFLCACGTTEEVPVTEAETSPAETTTAAPENTVIEAFSETEATETTVAETEPETKSALIDDETPPEEGMVRSPLTNLWVSAEQAQRRPVAIMYPTDKKAQPQYGLDRAEIFYEIMEEGSMSRQMAIVSDWDGLTRIGNIRSTRDYFILESMQWDSILVHFGGPEIFVKDLLTREDVDNINGVGGEMGSDYGAFYRIPAGSRSEHTAFTDSDHLNSAIQKAEFETTHREGYWTKDRWIFTNASNPVDLTKDASCRSAETVDMAGCFPITESTFQYNEEDGLYYRSIYGQPQKDAVSGNQMAFRNILIESCTWGERGAEYLYFHVLDEGHEGYYITGGKMIHCTWKRTQEYEPTRFYDDNGNEIVFNTGKTMICIVREGDSFKADGTKYGV